MSGKLINKKLSNNFSFIGATEFLKDGNKILCQWHIRKILGGYRITKKMLECKMFTINKLI